MGQYDGANRYTTQLTLKENMFCEAVVMEDLTHQEAYKKVYPEAQLLNSYKLDNKLKSFMRKDKIINRINELELVKQAKNQTEDKKVIPIEKNPKRFLLSSFIDFVHRCKQNGDRSNEIKGLESIAKLFNIYNENGNITNTQLNNIIINTKDVNSAIDQIHKLVNKQ